MDEPKILVAIRKRPLSKKEEAKGDNDIITCKNEQTVIVSEYKYPPPYPGKRSTSPSTSRKPSSTSTSLSTSNLLTSK